MANRAIRPIRIDGDIGYILLTKGLEAIIDVADIPLVQSANWHTISDNGRFYAHRSFKKRPDGVEVKLHRVLMLPPPGMVVDHINGDGLDNRRSNLRISTKAQNQLNSRKGTRNRSGFKGVSYDASRNKWQASIRSNRTTKFLGRYDTPEEAHAVYCSAAIRLHGQFANIG